MRTLILLVLTLLATACTGIPPGHQVVKPFQLDRYLGTWYEVARLDHGFERGLSRSPPPTACGMTAVSG
jgi:apolipoprotein D and lipocalin family protein